MNTLVHKILEDTKATTFQCYITAGKDETAFRRKLYAPYKQNRKDFVRPVHYDSLREHLLVVWKASLSETIEADDAISIASCSLDIPSVVVSIDKDLMQIPGLHYNFVKEEFATVNEYTGTKFFYEQLLKGDKADNVQGVVGIGDVKAKKLLAELDTEEEWFNKVREVYNDDESMLRQGCALWMMKEPYPRGVWAYTHYGNLLLQETTLEQEFSDTLKLHTLGPSTLTNGIQQSGQIQEVSTYQDTPLAEPTILI
jgi:5'-3' exonuclease